MALLCEQLRSEHTCTGSWDSGNDEDIVNKKLTIIRQLLIDPDAASQNPRLDVNGFDQDGHFPLWIAAGMSKGLALCQFLLEKGAWVDQLVPEASFKKVVCPTVLHIACRKGSLDIVKLFYEHVGTKDAFQGLMSIKNYCRQTPCWFAVSDGSAELVEWLIDNGCNMRECDVSGKTSLLNALEGNRKKIAVVELLAKHGDPSLEFNDVETHPLTQKFFHFSPGGVIAISNHLTWIGAIQPWEGELLSHCIGMSRKCFNPDFFHKTGAVGLLPLDMITAIICLSSKPDITEAYFTCLQSTYDQKFIVELLSKKLVMGLSAIEAAYHAHKFKKISSFPRILHFLLERGADAQDIRMFSNILNHGMLDPAATLLSGGLDLNNSTPQCDDKDSKDKTWLQLLEKANVSDNFLYILHASGQEEMVKKYLETIQINSEDAVHRPGSGNLEHPRVEYMMRTLLHMHDMGARSWFTRGSLSLMETAPSLYLLCIRYVRRQFSGRVHYKVQALEDLPQAIKTHLLLGDDRE